MLRADDRMKNINYRPNYRFHLGGTERGCDDVTDILPLLARQCYEGLMKWSAFQDELLLDYDDRSKTGKEIFQQYI